MNYNCVSANCGCLRATQRRYGPRAQVISFAGELLGAAEALLRDGLHTSEVADGYGKAAAKARAALAHPRAWPRGC
jgi:hypothetical protein